MRQRKRPLRLDRANVVGIIQSQAGFAAARRLAERKLDAVELRLDLFGAVPRTESLQALPVPIVATVRAESEGGARGIDDARRVELYRRMLGVAKAIDLELASLPALEEVAAAARSAKARLILSVHDFTGAPDRRALKKMVARAVNAGADVFKIAFTPGRLSELTPVLELLEEAPLPVAAMAMGRFGKVSRLLFAAGGSVLNYGWIERSIVPGQWSAAELRVRLDELTRTV